MAERLQKFLAPASFLLIILLVFGLWIKLHYAADITDESFYLATTDALIKWHKPFVMDINYAQTASILLIPLVMAYRTLVPSGEGIIFALRLAYIALAACTSICTFRFARERMQIDRAILLSYIPLVWIPFSLPALSYNTIGSNFFTMALLVSATGQARSAGKWLVVAILFLVAVVAYPSLAMPIGLYYLAVLALTRKENRVFVLWQVGLWLLMLCLAGCILIAWSGLPSLSRALHLVQDVARERAATRLNDFWQELTAKSVWARLLFVAALGFLLNLRAAKRFQGWLIFCLVLIMLYVVCSEPALFMASHEIITELVLVSLFCYVERRSDLSANSAETFMVRASLEELAFWTAVVAGLGTAWSSNNGFMNFVVGATPALIIGLCALLRRIDLPLKSGWRAQLPGVGLIGSVIAVLFFDAFTSVYGEYGARKSDLTYKVESGPFARLQTTPARGKLLAHLQKAIGQCAGSTVYVIGPPGVYLLARQKPMDITLFHRDDSKLGAYKSFFASFFADPHHHPDLIVKVEDEWFGRANAVDKELFEHYEMAISTAEFSIWKRRD